ncbi:GGDEF domain-containing protein [Deinococcus xianganensis]|uniref:Diguanylate cyclase n=1 Tax=Deinococcus xianganensis TaxID=1507289 RepID=A0A6I4YMM6_9DEIO|nr:GGDEF domain-containing protein [Deinococcus xianganensis]MXV21024.1 diguanylate cyclase [Deinococcus xianganensis]
MLTPNQYSRLLDSMSTLTEHCQSSQALLLQAEEQLTKLVNQPVRLHVATKNTVNPPLHCSTPRPLPLPEAELVRLFSSHLEVLLRCAQQYEHLSHQVHHDVLTGLLNRRAFERDAARALTHPPRRTLMLLDIRQFKQINDTFGHAAGDAVLRDVAQALKARTTPDCRTYRLAGDEFAVLTTQGADDLQLCSGELHCALSVSCGPQGPGSLILDSGLAVLQAGDTVCSWLHRADQDMYRHKRRSGGLAGRMDSVTRPLTSGRPG